MDLGIFATLLHSLHQALDPGLGALKPYVLHFLGGLLFLEMTRLAAAWSLGVPDLAMAMVRSLLRLGLLCWLIAGPPGYPTLVTWLRDSCVNLGLIAGGNALTVATFLDPGSYLAIGFRVGDVLYQALLRNLGINPATWVMALLFGLAWILFMVGYAVMACSVFMLQVELAVVVLGAVLLLPFAAFRGTTWIAQGAIGYPINVGFRFFIEALLASVTFPLLTHLTASEATLQTGFVMVLASWTLAFLYLKAPAIASGLLSGIPVLTAGQAMQAAVGTALVGAGIGSLAIAGGSVGAKVVGGWAAKVTGRQVPPGGTEGGGPGGGPPVRPPPRPVVGPVLTSTLVNAARYFAHSGGGQGTHPHYS